MLSAADLVLDRIPRLLAPASDADVFAEIDRRIARLRLRELGLRPFRIDLVDGRSRIFGQGEPAFHVTVRDEIGMRAVHTLDDLAIAEAYMGEHLDVIGELQEMLRYRPILSDRRPLQYLWETYLQSWVLGQIAADRHTIPAHYDLPSEFFELWLDDRVRGYSHGFFEHDDEPLSAGMLRKFGFAYDALGVQPGDRVLDIGGGWGSFSQFGGERGLRVTSVTISKESARFMRELIARKSLPCDVVEAHFLEYRSSEPFDAIVNLGVTEHLPDYRGTLAQYQRLLKPGKRIYLDAYSGNRFDMSSFVTRWVYEGNTSPLCLPRYFAELARTDLDSMLLENDTHNYELTCRKWAENLDRAAPQIVARWGELLYRRFRLYLWGCARAFADGQLSAHHMVLEHRPGLRAARRLFRF